MSYQIDREDLVLLLLNAHQRLASNAEFRGITRLEKLIFLLAKEQGVEAANDLYSFKAYKFGPFSIDVYEATEFLRGLGLLDISERSFTSYFASTEEELLAEEITEDDEEDGSPVTAREKIYSLTEAGKRAAESLRDIWEKERPKDLAKIDDTIRRFSILPLNQIIRYVYRRHPDMASNSIHPEAQQLSKN